MTYLFIFLMAITIAFLIKVVNDKEKQLEAKDERIRYYMNQNNHYFDRMTDYMTRNRGLHKDKEIIEDELSRAYSKSHIKDVYLDYRFKRIQELEDQLADALHDAESFSYLYNIALGESIKQNDKIFELKSELKYYREKYEGNYDPID